jgi:hypothetical protein
MVSPSPKAGELTLKEAGCFAAVTVDAVAVVVVVGGAVVVVVMSSISADSSAGEQAASRRAMTTIRWRFIVTKVRKPSK